MDIDLYTSGPITFIELDGEMTADNCMEVRDMVMEALAVRKKFIVIVKSVPYMDSTSIGTLMSLVKEVDLMDGEVKIVGLNPSLRRIFQLVNAEHVFELYDKAEDALKTFEAAPIEV